jgi:hypothetical protein
MAEKRPVNETESTEQQPEPELPAEPRYAVEITMSPAELENLRSELKKRFH